MTLLHDIQKVYVAFFNRPADAEGLAFWHDTIASGRASFSDIVSSFVDSREYRELYAGSSNEDVVKSIYVNLFGREPEAEGLQYWVEAIASGTADPATLAYQVLNGSQGADRTIVDNKAAAASIFTQELAGTSAPYDEQLVEDARIWLGRIDERPIDKAAIARDAKGTIEAANDHAPVEGQEHVIELGWNGIPDPHFYNRVTLSDFDAANDTIRIDAREGYDFSAPGILHFSAYDLIGETEVPSYHLGALRIQGDRGDGKPMMAGEAGIFTYTDIAGKARMFLLVDDGLPAPAGWGNGEGTATYNRDSDLLVEITGATNLAYVNGGIDSFLAA